MQDNVRSNRQHGGSMKPQRKPVTGAPQQVRIIGGTWKRTPLAVVQAEGLRPTPDRVRETVFNWLGHLLTSGWEHTRCLDLFAGTGAMGFEAASRGAPQVTMIEKYHPAVRQLEVVKNKLSAQKINIMHGDVLSLAQGLIAQGAKFQLIFADPPYHQGWLERIMPLCQQLLAQGGLLYVETERLLSDQSSPSWLDSWEILRADKAGMVFYHLLHYKNLV